MNSNKLITKYQFVKIIINNKYTITNQLIYISECKIQYYFDSLLIITKKMKNKSINTYQQRMCYFLFIIINTYIIRN